MFLNCKWSGSSVEVQFFFKRIFVLQPLQALRLGMLPNRGKRENLGTGIDVLPAIKDKFLILLYRVENIS